MVKGNKVTEFIPLKEVLARTNGGYDIYMYYLGSVRRIMSRPWGKKERNPSWGIYPFSGLYFWKDQATEETGNAITFVEKFFGLSFHEAMMKVCWDFGFIQEGGVRNASPVQITWEKPYGEEKYARIDWDSKPFEKGHHDFWNIAEVTEADCKAKNYYAVNDLAIKGKRVPIKKGEIVFAFHAPEEDSVKIYFPHRKEYRFRNNISYHYLWNYSNVTECEDLIIQKSPKDLIVTSLVQPCVIATQNESVKVFDEETIERINKISKRPWVWYGSDDDGVKKCKEITDCNKWRYVNTPKNLLPAVNDTYSFVRMHNILHPGTGLRELENFMKLKKLIK